MAISLVGTASTDAATGTAISLTHGLTIAANDVVIASVHVNGSSTTATDNNGANAFTGDGYAASGDSARHYLFHRVAGASEPSAYAFTGSASGRWSIIVRVYRGVDTSDVWDVDPVSRQDHDVGEADPLASSITILTAGAWGVIFSSDDFFPTTTTLTSFGSSYTNAKTESGQQFQTSADKAYAATGATGTVSVAMNNADGYVSAVTWHMALKPAVGKLNIGDTWKVAGSAKINIGDSWKTVVAIKQNIGDTWKVVL